ncbi:MAG: metallophosphoesterase [Eubacteriales bacterium]
MLKIIHASDFHLDGIYEGVSPQKACERRQEQQDLLNGFRDIVVEKEADLVLLAGDLFENVNVHPETIDQIIQCLASLPCWVFITPGEHDYFWEKSPYVLWKWPQNVYIFKEERTKAVTTPVGEGKSRVTIYGNAFTSPHRKQSPLEKFTPPRNWSGYHIMVSYGSVEEEILALEEKNPKEEDLPQEEPEETAVKPEEKEEEEKKAEEKKAEEKKPETAEPSKEMEEETTSPILLSEIAHSSVHYLALGGRHNRSTPKRAGRTYYTYAGSAQGQNFEELESKGVLYLELEITGEATLSFIPLKSRQYHAVAVDITGQETLLENLRKGLSERYPDRHRDIFRVILTGEAMGPNIQSLTEGLQDEFYGLEILDQSVLPQRIWDKKEDESLTALFLQEMEKVSPENLGGEIDQATYQMALRLGLAALENREDFAL